MPEAISPGADRSRPSIILLHGCSGAGKTSIGRSLQASLAPPHVLTGADDFIFKLLPRQWHGVPDGVQFRPASDGSVPLHFGPGGLAMRRAFQRSVAAMATCGLHVIVDDVILDADWLADWLDVLAGTPVFFVGVHCDFEELAEREAARPDRAKGHMQTHFHQVHAHADYDVVVDTTATPTWRCARQIVEAIEQVKTPTAFERLRTARRAPGPA